MLLKNQILDTLYIQGVNFGNDGMKELVKAFNFGLDDMVKAQKARNAQVGEFIQAGKEKDQAKDYSILPQLKLDEHQQNMTHGEDESLVTLKRLFIS